MNSLASRRLSPPNHEFLVPLPPRSPGRVPGSLARAGIGTKVCSAFLVTLVSASQSLGEGDGSTSGISPPPKLVSSTFTPGTQLSSTAAGRAEQASGANYQLHCAAGQPDATALSGGDYVISGGFWTPDPVIDAPDALSPDPSGVNKSRFISFVPPPNTAETAIRVRLDSLHHVVPPYTGGPSVPFTSFEGQVRWVGPPVTYMESSASQLPFYASSLQCAPHYQDWSTVGLLHVGGSAIVPSSIYGVENVAASCLGTEESCTAVSSPLVVTTTRWGDVELPYNPPDPTAQPNASDIGALVNKFRGALGAPIKARALLTGSDGFGNISIAPDFSFIHIASCVDAFRGLPYPFAIQACP